MHFYVQTDIRASAGGKRAKAMALMASNAKKRTNRQKTNGALRDILEMNATNKKEFTAICNTLNRNKFVTPCRSSSSSSLKTSNFTSLRKSRNVITPFGEEPFAQIKKSENIFDATPKHVDEFKHLQTPMTPTPIKMMKKFNVSTPKTALKKESSEILTPTTCKMLRSLNVRTPETEKNAKKGSITDRKIRRKLSICMDEKADDKLSNELPSWKDVDHNKRIQQKTQKNAKNAVKKDLSLSDYERLLKATRCLPLPLKWGVLLQKFNALESTMGLYQRKNSFFVHSQNITKSVQQIVKKRFTDKDLQRILSVVPDFYHIQWTASYDKLTKHKGLKLTLTALDYDPHSDEQIELPFDKCLDDEKLKEIGIAFMKVSKLKEREKIFRLRLIQYVAFHHKQWLEDNILAEFDPLEAGNWHKHFDLENVQDIKLSPFPQKPNKNVDQIEKMIKSQEKKLEEIVAKEIEIAKQNEKEKEKENDAVECSKLAIPKHLQHLSPTFMAKIRAKNKSKIKMVTTKRLKSKEEYEEDDEQYRLQQLPYLVSLIRGIYVQSKKSGMACDALVKVIKKRHRNHHVLDAEIWKQLQMLDSLKSKFFYIKQGKIIKVARLNKKIPTKEVLDEINSKIIKKG